MREQRWNHNIHYQRLVLREIPAGARRALDVGCGEGILTRELAARIPEVVGVDLSAEQIALARAADSGVDYVHGDFLRHDFGERFDLVASIATLHHVDARDGLRRLASLLRPGGRLVVVGVGRVDLVRDLPWEIAGAVTTRVLKLRNTYWEHSAPILDPGWSRLEMKRLARAELPGVRFRRLVLWRYLLTWTAPQAARLS